jgi:pyrroloquinoline-quinone synthase
MTCEEFFCQLDANIAKYDLLCHPFYKAWAAGELTREDLRAYAENYFHHVEAFPGYLAELALRLEDCELRRAVLANMSDEQGAENSLGGSEPVHAELWLDFAEGMGADRDKIPLPIAELKGLIEHFSRVAREGAPEEALAAFYAYESQVPRIAQEKARGLREMYGANERTCAYFTLHATADVHHSGVWRRQLEKCLEADPQAANTALAAAESAAQALWHALDGIEERRTAHLAANQRS